MECRFCASQMSVLSMKYRIRSSEIEEYRFICPQCHHYVVIKDGLCSWYDKNDKLIHASHDN